MKKYIVTLFTSLCLLGMTSCDHKQAAIDELEGLAEDLKESSEQYTKEDWNAATEQYQAIETELEQYEFTDEELKEIGKIKARCFKYFSKGSIMMIGKELKSFRIQLEGAIEELSKDDSLEENVPF